MAISNNPEDVKTIIQPVFGILITHFDIGRELLRAAESIVSPQDNIVVLSNQGMGFDGLQQQIRSTIPDDMDVIVMVDNFGGSTHIAARAVCESNKRIALICGVNLPMLLSFITKRDQLDFSKLVEVVREDSIRGIR
jgi:PTS system mannose-specific IIA component